MNAVTPTPYHECMQLFWIKVAWQNRVHSWYGFVFTTFIYGMELVWPHSFMVRSLCGRVHSWYGVDAIPQSHSTWFCEHCTEVIHLADFLLFVFHQLRVRQLIFFCNNKNKQGLPLTTQLFLYHEYSNLNGVSHFFQQKINFWKYNVKKSTKFYTQEHNPDHDDFHLRSWCNLVKWPYRVKKVGKKWLLPVKVTIEVINPILHTAWLGNHALTLKRNSAKYYFHEKFRFLHTFLKFCCELRKI